MEDCILVQINFFYARLNLLISSSRGVVLSQMTPFVAGWQPCIS